MAGLAGSGSEQLPYAVAGALGREASGQLRLPEPRRAMGDTERRTG